MSEARRLRWYRPRALLRSVRLRPRILGGVACGVLALLLLPSSLSASLQWALAWDIGGLAYLTLAFDLMVRAPIEHIKQHAARDDEGRFVILFIILLAIASSFAAIIGLLSEAKEAERAARLLLLGMAALTIMVSWSVMQMLFAIHYAHEHYAALASSGNKGAMIFPDDAAPDYWDFLYFSTSIGATSQTSDVSIRSKLVRRLVTFHAMIAFFFNTIVLALTINLAAGLAT